MKKLKEAKKRLDSNIKENGIGHVIWSGILIILIFFASAALLFALYIIISAPNFDKDALYSKEATIIYYKDGTEMARIGHENRQLINYSDLPQVYIDALLATEDSRFFQHNGLDMARFLKASAGQIFGNDSAGGASTLTMQLVKNNYTDNTATGIKGIVRKFTDIYMAVFKIENSYTKEEIIEFYVNSLWLGNDGNVNTGGIYGVETASQYYFGKSISEVNLAEATILVGMYQNASLYNPYLYPENCRARQRVVLKLMVQHGYISEDEMESVLEIPIEDLLAGQSFDDSDASNGVQDVIDYVKNEVKEKTGRDPFQEPMQIYTTIDKDKQDILNDLEEGKLYKFVENPTEDNSNIDQEATVITSVADGSVVALSGGRYYTARGNNRATVIKRQPGSSIKPIMDYAPYIEYLNGSSGDYFFDNAYSYSNGTSIQNADHKFMGQIPLRYALSQSRNIPALQAFQKVMAKDSSLIPNLVHSVGIDYGNTLYESASIGGFEGVTPLQMSAVYAMFSRGGYYIEPYVFTKIIYEDGTTFDYKPEKNQVLSPETCYMITSSLMDAVKGGWSGNINVSGTEVAGKTGTTSLREADQAALGVPDGTTPDVWNITYNSEYAIAFWYGYDTITPEHFTNIDSGYNARLYIMSALANRIYSPNKKFSVPSGLIQVKVEKDTVPLQLPSPNTPEDMIITEYFREGTEPAEVSTRYLALDAPTDGNYTLSGNTITLNWKRIDLPKAIDSSYLQKYFNDNYGRFANSYYEKRLEFNDSAFGALGYQVYLQSADGSLTDLGWYSDNTYTQSVEPGQKYTFVIKSAYRNFKGNASSGLVISANVSSNIKPDDIDIVIPGVDPEEDDDIVINVRPGGGNTGGDLD